MTRKRLAILISGRGSNMQALLEAARDPAYPARPVVVISNRTDAGGLEIAASHGIETLVVPNKSFPDRASFDRALGDALAEREVDIIALAGFMRILTSGFIQRFEGRILNIHPSLLPKYQGLDTHGRAIAAGDSETGCTVHVVTEKLDDGPIIAQARVPIFPDDTPDSLAARILPQEHLIYPRALAEYVRSMDAHTGKAFHKDAPIS